MPKQSISSGTPKTGGLFETHSVTRVYILWKTNVKYLEMITGWGFTQDTGEGCDKRAEYRWSRKTRGKVEVNENVFTDTCLFLINHSLNLIK